MAENIGRTAAQLKEEALRNRPDLAEESYQEDGIWYTPDHKVWKNQDRAERADRRHRVDAVVFGKYADKHEVEPTVTAAEAAELFAGDGKVYTG